MPKPKADLTAAEPPEETTFYFVKVPTGLLKKVEAKRKKRMHNKTAAVLTMIDLYLQSENT